MKKDRENLKIPAKKTDERTNNKHDIDRDKSDSEEKITRSKRKHKEHSQKTARKKYRKEKYKRLTEDTRKEIIVLERNKSSDQVKKGNLRV